MEEVKNIRINKVLRELNISLERAVDYLKDKGIAIEASPNTKISDEVYNILCGQFAGDKGNIEASKSISVEIKKEKEGIRLERIKNVNNLPIELETEIKVKRSKKQNELALNIINNNKSKFYLVDSPYSNYKINNDFIWEQKDKNRILISLGDVLIFKSVFISQNGGGYYLKISGIGIVTKSIPEKNNFYFNLMFSNRIDIKITESTNYDNSIVLPSNDFLKSMLLKIEVKDLEKLNDALINFSNQNTELKIETVEKYSNITTLPGISSDSDDGEDYLDIKDDVNAFARVMAAKSFEPPLALSLIT
jgi:hypothetical protein